MTPILPRTQVEIDANTWSLSARIAEALVRAEARFGPRDGSFAILGYEFRAEGPFLSVNPGARTVEILLPHYCEHDHNQAIYQASHEVTHILAPAGYVRPTNLEEGLATLFSEQHTLSVAGVSYVAPKKNYSDACAAVREFLADDSVMRLIRAEQPTFSDMTPEMLIRHRPGCSAELAAFLCAAFQA